MVSPRDLDSSTYKKIGFKTREIGMQWVKDNISNYKKLTKQELIDQLTIEYSKLLHDKKITIENEIKKKKHKTVIFL